MKKIPDKIGHRCGEVTFKTQCRYLTPLVKKLIWTLFLLSCQARGFLTSAVLDVCGFSLVRRKVSIYVFSNSYDLLGTQRAFIRLLFLRHKYRRFIRWRLENSWATWPAVCWKLIPHSGEPPIPEPSQSPNPSTESVEVDYETFNPDFLEAALSKETHLLSLEGCTDLVRDLNLSKTTLQHTQLFGSIKRMEFIATKNKKKLLSASTRRAIQFPFTG